MSYFASVHHYYMAPLIYSASQVTDYDLDFPITFKLSPNNVGFVYDRVQGRQTYDILPVFPVEQASFVLG